MQVYPSEGERIEMGKVLSARSELGAEMLFLANYGVAKQSSAEAQRAKDIADRSRIACNDCGDAYLAGELDGSTGLCEVCYEVAGIENEAQDGYLTDEEADAKIAALRGGAAS